MLRRARLLREHAENARLMARTVAAYDRDCLLLLATDWLKAAEQLEHKSQERQGTPRTARPGAPFTCRNEYWVSSTQRRGER